MKVTRNRLLALVAFVLGAVAVVGDPHGGPVVQLNSNELATIVESEVDHVEATELADWILRGDTEYRLLDLRDEAGYLAYHIPTAENVAITELTDYPLLRNERVVLYSGGGIHSAQAWFLLKAKRFPGAYILLGGLEAWKDEVLFPALPVDASPEQAAAFARASEVAEFFGGHPRTGVDETATEAAPLPDVAAPAPIALPQRSKKKSKEGC